MPSDLFTPPRQRSASGSNTSTASSLTWAPASTPRIPLYPSPSTTAVSSGTASPFPTPKPKKWKHSRKAGRWPKALNFGFGRRPAWRWLAVLLCIFLSLLVWYRPRRNTFADQLPSDWREDATIQDVLRPTTDSDTKTSHDPERWLREHSDNAYAINQQLSLPQILHWSPRPKAAIISLVRNEELAGIMQSMRQLEHRWNHKYRYPWIFFNEKPFTPEFIAATSNLTSARCFYETIPPAHWSTPSWIDQSLYMDSLDYLGTIGVGKGWMLSYRSMCRWNSGFFYLHPALASYDFYWRVEPDVHFLCDIHYDVFRFMRDNDLKYGFNMNILDDARSFPSLWSQTLSFINAHPDLIHPSADLTWLLDPQTGHDYNNCQFFSNFEIGSLSFFRDTPNTAYFAHLDASGGFHYERYGDAPIHTLSASLFLPKSQIWFFRDIGYQHDIARHCPPNAADRCACEPTSLDANFYRLVPMESPQRKPSDTCIRQFLGGKWLETKDGWDQEAERNFGGDGYGGYVLDGMS